jgi:hypothetical protein
MDGTLISDELWETYDGMHNKYLGRKWLSMFAGLVDSMKFCKDHFPGMGGTIPEVPEVKVT